MLIDTSVLLWAALHPNRLSGRAADLLNDTDSIRYLSPLSTFEISQKAARGKLELPLPAAQFVNEAVRQLELEWLPLTHDHLAAVDRIPWIHRDPFDRMLALQAFVEDIPIVSPDPQFDAMGVQRIW